MSTAVVIGSSSGFGKGIADELEKRYDRVLRMSRSETGVDVTNYDRMKRLFENEPDVDAVVYSAGIAIDLLTIDKGTPENWNQVFAVNTIGLINVLKVSRPALERSKGHMIYLGSIASQLAYEGGADYCASKAAARTIMHTYRAEVAGTGIRSTLIEPGLGDTRFQLNRYKGDAERAAKHFGDIHQLKPDDVADLVVYILSLGPFVNLDEVIIKPLEQISHGKLRPIAR